MSVVYLNTPPTTLVFRHRQRVNLARALITKPTPDAEGL